MAYQKIDKDSVNSITNALNLFHLPATDVSIAASRVFEILPSNPLTDVPYHFRVHPSENYVDLTRCYVYSEFSIRKEDANGNLVKLAATDNVAPINLIGLTFMKNLRVSVNGREIFNSNSLMPYKVWFDHELSMSNAKQGWMNAGGYYRDSEEGLEQGTGYDARKELFKESKKACFMVKLDSDLFCQPLFLLNHCLLELEIEPHKSDFLLIAPPAADGAEQATRYHFSVDTLRLYVRMCELHDSLALSISRKLDSQPARYPLRRSVLKSFFITEGRSQFQTNLFLDQIPRRVTLGLIANDDFVGKKERSPFNFQPFGVQSISIIANGRIHPHAPYNLDYDRDLYVRPFVDAMESIGLINGMDSNLITYKQFKKTHCIYVFNLSDSAEDASGAFNLIRNGNCQVDIKFRKVVPEGGVILVVMGEQEQLLFLSADRIVSTDNTQ